MGSVTDVLRRKGLARMLRLLLGGVLVAAVALPGRSSAEGGGPATQVRTAADLVGARQWESYFPFRLGDSWTYDWRTDGPLAPGGLAVRTRTFDGTSFVGDDVGYKLVADDGAHHLYTFVRGILAIHSSSDGRRLLYYDPPVVIAAPDFTVGETRVVPQTDGTREFRTTFVGLEDITVPLGSVSRALVTRLEMRGSDYTSEATHHFAPRVGLVAYRYVVREAGSNRLLMSVDARLRLARLSGVDVTRLSDLDKVPGGTAPAAAAEDRGLRDRLRRALGRRYTWDAGFAGFRGDAELIEEGKPSIRGRFVVAPDLGVRIDAADDAARGALRNEISSFITQRKEVVFDLAYGRTTFVAAGKRPDGAVVVTAAGDPLATTYVLSGDDVVEVGRSVGRLRYVARDRQSVATGDGRSITTEYDVVYISNETQQEISVERTRDTYTRLDGHWVPTGRHVERTAAGQPPLTRELRLTNLARP
jgi:hypothetical protein